MILTNLWPSKQGQGHQTLYEVVDPKEEYNNAKIKKPRLNSVHEKANDKVLPNQDTRQLKFLSLKYVQQ